MTETARGKVSIVVPAYAEERRIGPAVVALKAFAAEFPRLTEVLVVVEPSGDRTADVARDAAGAGRLFTIIENDVHRGKGHAVRTGMMRAAGDIIIFMDADLSVPLEYVRAFVAHLDAHIETDIAIGNRRHPSSNIARRQHPLRENAGCLFNRVARGLGLTASDDTQCGFKAFRRKAAREVFRRARLDGFSFDVEVLLIARILGFRVDELPVEWLNDEDTKFRPFRDGWRSLFELLRLRASARKAARS
jgi:dolichyl-phosphate beta-glucosyltransferase